MTTVQKWGLIIPAIGSIVVPILLLIFSHFRTVSEKYKLNMAILFKEVICPINKLLEKNTNEDFNTVILKKIEYVYVKNLYLIPKEMHKRFYDLKTSFIDNNCSDKKAYNRYKKYMKIYLSYSIRKLHYPKNYARAYICSMSLRNFLALFVPLIVLFVGYGISLWLSCLIGVIVFIISSFLYLIVFAIVDFLLYNKKKKKCLNEKIKLPIRVVMEQQYNAKNQPRDRNNQRHRK